MVSIYATVALVVQWKMKDTDGIFNVEQQIIHEHS